MKRKDFIKWSTGGLLSSAIHVTIPASGRVNSEQNPGSDPSLVFDRTEFFSSQAMVCTSQPLAVAVGCNILSSGGNAIDAAIAVNAMLGLTEPMMCGVGGDLFAMVWIEKDQKLYGLNASGRSPYDWSISDAKKMGLQRLPSFGPLSWSVPGCVSGWGELQKRFGSKTMGEILQPAIAYALDGFPVTEVIAEGWKPEQGANDHATLEGTYLFDGKGPGKGEIYRNPALAKTLQALVNGGPGVFYEGEIADRIIRFSKEHGGRFSKKDFIDHAANWLEPVYSSYRGFDIWQLPPSGQGLVVLQMLNILEQFEIRKLVPGSAEFFHLFLEAKKLCFEDRAVYYADNDLSTDAISELISKEYAARRSRLINPKRSMPHFTAGRLKNNSNTVYVTTADGQGNMVSLIQSLYSPWGSHYVIKDLGFALQNRGACFSLDDSALNKLEPHKRPFHTIIPSFVTQNKRPAFSFGVTGGDFQSQGQVQLLANIIDHEMPVQKAGNQLRLWHRETFETTNENPIDSGKVVAEPGFSHAVLRQLEEMGHRFSKQQRFFGGYQGIWRQDHPRVYIGASDCRKDGCSFGF
jgi:gamma-glutamyltranspeptidase/glutathione hydrolase